MRKKLVTIIGVGIMMLPLFIMAALPPGVTCEDLTEEECTSTTTPSVDDPYSKYCWWDKTSEKCFAAVPELELTLDKILDMIDTAVVWIFNILMAAGLLVILFAAFTFLTAGGDPNKIGAARGYLMWGLVGIAVALFARGFISMLRSFIETGTV